MSLNNVENKFSDKDINTQSLIQEIFKVNELGIPKIVNINLYFIILKVISNISSYIFIGFIFNNFRVYFIIFYYI